jgi:hypothetical protein
VTKLNGEYTYTNKKRFRVEKRLFGPDLVVLQVKVKWRDGDPDCQGMPNYLAGEGWRDATPEDLQWINNQQQADVLAGG